VRDAETPGEWRPVADGGGRASEGGSRRIGKSGAVAAAEESEAAGGERDECVGAGEILDPDAVGFLQSRDCCFFRSMSWLTRKRNMLASVTLRRSVLPVILLTGIKLHPCLLYWQRLHGCNGSGSQTTPAFRHRSHCEYIRLAATCLTADTHLKLVVICIRVHVHLRLSVHLCIVSSLKILLQGPRTSLGGPARWR
jgi:hypothetical protein